MEDDLVRTNYNQPSTPAQVYQEMQTWRDECLQRQALCSMWVDIYRSFKEKMRVSQLRGGEQTALIVEQTETIKEQTGTITKLSEAKTHLEEKVEKLEEENVILQTEAMVMKDEEILCWRKKLADARRFSTKLCAWHWKRLVRLRQNNRAHEIQQRDLLGEVLRLKVVEMDLFKERKQNKELRATIKEKNKTIARLEQMGRDFQALQTAHAELQAEKNAADAEIETLKAMKVTRPILPAKFMCARCCHNVNLDRKRERGRDLANVEKQDGETVLDLGGAGLALDIASAARGLVRGSGLEGRFGGSFLAGHAGSRSIPSETSTEVDDDGAVGTGGVVWSFGKMLARWDQRWLVGFSGGWLDGPNGPTFCSQICIDHL